MKMKRLFPFLLISLFVLSSCKKESAPTSSIIEINPPTLYSPPVLSSPINGDFNQDISPVLSWNAANDASSYSLQVSESSAFQSYVYNQSGLTDTSQQISGLSYSKSYYWRVNAKYSQKESDWSTPFWTFTTLDHAFQCGSQIVYSGQAYNTVQIGSQCWLKENLNVGTMIAGYLSGKNNGIIHKYCYNDDSTNCQKYGGLYRWDEAMAYSKTEGTKGICPSGWHIPTSDEMSKLGAAVQNNGNGLKAIGQGYYANYENGVGTNTSGFSALLAGNRIYNGSFTSLAYSAIFWSSTETVFQGGAITLELSGWDSSLNVYYENTEAGFSIRCIKN